MVAPMISFKFLNLFSKNKDKDKKIVTLYDSSNFEYRISILEDKVKQLNDKFDSMTDNICQMAIVMEMVAKSQQTMVVDIQNVHDQLQAALLMLECENGFNDLINELKPVSVDLNKQDSNYNVFGLNIKNDTSGSLN